MCFRRGSLGFVSWSGPETSLPARDRAEFRRESQRVSGFRSTRGRRVERGAQGTENWAPFLRVFHDHKRVGIDET